MSPHSPPKSRSGEEGRKSPHRQRGHTGPAREGTGPKAGNVSPVLSQFRLGTREQKHLIGVGGE